jgi:dCMP deaminase
MKSAFNYTELSHCKRRKVGALLVSPDNRPLLSGYNGTSPGRDNCCEHEGVTKDIVHHAEANLIGNAAKRGIATEGCSIFITTSPCIQCAKLIEISGITTVYYHDTYTDPTGVDYLVGAGICVEQLEGVFDYD